MLSRMRVHQSPSVARCVIKMYLGATFKLFTLLSLLCVIICVCCLDHPPPHPYDVGLSRFTIGWWLNLIVILYKPSVYRQWSPYGLVNWRSYPWKRDGGLYRSVYDFGLSPLLVQTSPNLPWPLTTREIIDKRIQWNRCKCGLLQIFT